MILVLGGTSEARTLAAELRAAGHDVLLSAATEYGARLAAPSGVDVRGGALDEEELAQLVEDAVAVVDATHPFAELISGSAARACTRAGRPYLRFRRPSGVLSGDVVRAADAAEAARLAVELALASASPPRVDDGGRPGVIFLTVGSKTVATYARAAQDAGVRLVARVLPTPEALAACAGACLEPRDIVALQGPASAELDAALLRHLGAVVLVTKESGDAGGLGEKLRAAELAGARAVVVQRPAEPGTATTAAAATSSADVLAWLEVLPATAAADGPDCQATSPSSRITGGGRRRPLPQGLLQVYTGAGKGKTSAAVGQALRARGAGLAVTFVQFVKGGRESSELEPLRAAGVRVTRPAVARSGLLGGEPTSQDRVAAAAAWATVRAVLADDSCDLVVLDELHAALRHGLVELAEVLAAISARPACQEVVTTGRGAPEELLAAADLITEMTAVRHPYPGVPARKGVEL